ncbi:ribosomal export complex protein Arx1 [Schizosaccharomyces japonicus yFS275]|uniref:Probable metalloprotease ARX1 n=1 Tax=Schizosaccharomyces japonicus (strain yFS275 / FY16936) TaxID=402676 RepID=B6JVR3_SCHJY|nr:ribosomal export complex protein Arx1 [Schizosaccharomyces japonicus yFS275]EEB05464.1 ribosomal export complex protein Arx1 [Schizosaccharomyces japonicus yFS275]
MDVDYAANDDNALTDLTLSKYRLAGSFVSKALQKIVPMCVVGASTKAICEAGDEFLTECAATVYKSSKYEKGIAEPTSISVNNCARGYSPAVNAEVDDSYVLQIGDVVKIAMAFHIDGYTASLAHTIVITPQPTPGMGPYIGPGADAICAAHFAADGVTKLLGSANAANPITPSRIRAIVEEAAAQFHVHVCPGSRVRRIKRFLVGQTNVEDYVADGADLKHSVEWPKPEEEELKEKQQAAKGDDDLAGLENTDEWSVMPQEAWLIDISMSSKPINRLKEHPDLKPTVFVHDVNVSYMLKLKTARALLAEIQATKSVYPFHTRTLTTEGSHLGIRELVNRHILVPHPVLVASPSTIIAREETTVLVQPNMSTDILRLAVPTAPSYVKSEFSLEPGSDIEVFCNGVRETIKNVSF